MATPMMQTISLNVGHVHLYDHSGDKVTHNLTIEFFEAFPNKLFIRLEDDDTDGYHNAFSYDEVEKLKKFITKIHNLMKGDDYGEKNQNSS